MKISKLIKNEIEEERATHENPMALDDHDVGFVCGMIRCKKIAQGHESQYGWQLCFSADDDTWYMVRDTPGATPYPATVHDGEWTDSGGDQYEQVFPTEFYRIPEDEQ